MKYAKDFRASARTALVGKWGISLAVTLVAALLGGYSGGGLQFNFTFNNNDLSNIWHIGGLDVSALFARAGIQTVGAASVIASLSGLIAAYSLAVFVIGGAVELGHNMYYIKLMRGEAAGMDTLFSRFEVFLKALGLRLFMMLFIFLWALLLIIPGIVAGYRYRMAPYLMAEHPEMGIRQAVDESKRMTDGYKGRWFCLDFSFIGWVFLCMLTFGIGLLWLNPYMSAANADFYMNILSERAGGAAPADGAGFGNDGPQFEYKGPERL